jgi:hypothetical protein
VPAVSTGVFIETPSLTPEETKFVKRMTAFVPRSPKQMSSLRRRFTRAGFYTLTPVALYTLAQVICPIAFGLAPLWFNPPRAQAWLFMIISGLVGYQVGLWLWRKTSSAKQIKQLA